MIKRASYFISALLLLCLSACQTDSTGGKMSSAKTVKPLRVLLVLGGGYHDYTKQKDILKAGIEERANAVVDISFTEAGGSSSTTKFDIFNQPDWSKNYDVVIHDECSADVKDLDYIHGILKPHENGLPGVVLHCAMHSFRSEGWKGNAPSMTPWFEFTGLQTTGHGAQLPIALTFIDKENPITKGMEDWTTGREELYNNIAGKVLDTAKPLVRGKQGNSDNVVSWTNQYHKGRVFGTTLGHNNATVADPRYLDLVTRGMLWACDKLNDKYLKPAPKKTTSIWLPDSLLIGVASGTEVVCGLN